MLREKMKDHTPSGQNRQKKQSEGVLFWVLFC